VTAAAAAWELSVCCCRQILNSNKLGATRYLKGRVDVSSIVEGDKHSLLKVVGHGSITPQQYCPTAVSARAVPSLYEPMLVHAKVVSNRVTTTKNKHNGVLAAGQLLQEQNLLCSVCRTSR
jgi:hypothetical protein